MDNRYVKYGCPALMQDGRFITNYLPNRTIEQYIRAINNVDSAQDYRLFLQQNGDVIMNREREYMLKQNTCQVNGICSGLDGTDTYKCVINFDKNPYKNPYKTDN